MSLIPLESNPEVMTKLLHRLGMPKNWNIVDVYGLDPDSLAVLLKPVLALILLYPLSAKHTAAEHNAESNLNISPNVYFMKQFLENACGTIALMHSVVNNLDMIPLEDGFLKSFLEKTKNLTSEERGEKLLEEEDLIEIHRELSLEGQSWVPTQENPVVHHFVAFIQKDGHIYELDGVKDFPVNHGPSMPDTFLEDAAVVCRSYMERDPYSICYTMAALVPTASI